MDVEAHPEREGLTDWPEEMIGELEETNRNGRVGHRLLSETDKVRVWFIDLEPGERIGFHCHVLDYFWTAVTDGKSRSRHSDGRTFETAYVAGDTKHFIFSPGEIMHHDLHNIGDTKLQFVTVEFKDSANMPLEI